MNSLGCYVDTDVVIFSGTLKFKNVIKKKHHIDELLENWDLDVQCQIVPEKDEIWISIDIPINEIIVYKAKSFFNDGEEVLRYELLNDGIFLFKRILGNECFSKIKSYLPTIKRRQLRLKLKELEN